MEQPFVVRTNAVSSLRSGLIQTFACVVVRLSVSLIESTIAETVEMYLMGNVLQNQYLYRTWGLFSRSGWMMGATRN